MKVVLSRKGLDSTFDSKANLLIFNGEGAELVMLPIPESTGNPYSSLKLCDNKLIYKALGNIEI